MKTLHVYTTQRWVPVTINPISEYPIWNSNTPLGLTPGGTHTIAHAIQYRVMTTTTRMTKLL
jgi:hypothetical protein